ncbi:MAG TPA: TlpA disulfide reductase family protein [Pyrinomonadaceae bacterium]|jgi:thiol-disulfide isomerase/thioredoxin
MSQDYKSRIWTGRRLAHTLLVFVLLATALSAGCNQDADFNHTKTTTNAPAAPAAPPAKPAPAPALTSLPADIQQIEMQTLDGQPFRLADYSGKVLVLDLWATWCGPCRLEIPELVALHKEYKARGVEVVGLTIEGLTEQEQEQKADAVRRFASDFKINYRIGWADQNLAISLLSPSGSIPQTYVIGRDGRIVGKFRGYSPAVGAQIRQWVDQALGETQAKVNRPGAEARESEARR